MTDKFFKKFSYSYRKPNSIFNYCGLDDIELYNVNLKKNKDLLEKNNWIDAKITYSFNNYGFRTPDNFDIINLQDGNMFLGCSITEGIGLHLEDTWAYKINKKLNGDAFYNLAQGGTGIDTMYRLLKAWTPILKPKNVYILPIFKNRKEFINKKNQQYDIVGPWLIDERFGKSPLDKIKRFFYKNFLIAEEETEIFWERTWDAIKYVAKQYDVNLYTLNASKYNDARTESHNKESWARDCIHYGVVFHDMISDFDCWEKIN